MGEKGAVVSKQQLSDDFLNGFSACEETNSFVFNQPVVSEDISQPADHGK